VGPPFLTIAAIADWLLRIDAIADASPRTIADIRGHQVTRKHDRSAIPDILRT
jgi:hypothetical protein